MTIKLLLLLAIAVAMAFALRGSRSITYLAVRRAAIVVVAAMAVSATLFPNALSWVAQRVGVGRGTDLITYALVVVVVFIALGLHQRIQHLEERVIELSRAVALKHADAPDAHEA